MLKQLNVALDTDFREAHGCQGQLFQFARVRLVDSRRRTGSLRLFRAEDSARESNRQI